MQGENNSLINEFPEHKAKIESFIESDSFFKEKADTYNKFDDDIRNFGLKNSAVDDETMHQLKHDRGVLKDWFYQKLV